MPPAAVKDVYVTAPRFEEFESCTHQEWLDDSPSSRKDKAWVDFKNSVNDGNRHIPRRLALSHWHTLEDFQWVSQNLPNLRELDISDVQDGVLIDSTKTDPLDFYTWEGLRNGVDGEFWAKIEKLWVRHWGCLALQNSIFRHPSAVNKSADLLSYRSRRDGLVRDSVCDVTTVIAACTNLKVLSVRGPTVGGGLNKAWHPKKSCIAEGGHAHFCTLVERLEELLWLEKPVRIEVLELHLSEIGLLLPMLAKYHKLKVKISFAPFLARYAAGRLEADVSDPEFEEWPKKFGTRRSGNSCAWYVKDYGPLAGLSSEEKEEQLHQWHDFALSHSFKECPWANPGLSDKLHAAMVQLHKTGVEGPDKNQLLRQQYFLMKYHSSGPLTHPLLALIDDLERLTETRHNPRYQLMTADSAEAYNNVPISPFTFIRPWTTMQSVEEVETTAHTFDAEGSIFGAKDMVFNPAEESTSMDGDPLQLWKGLQNLVPGWAPLWDLDSLMSVGFPMNEGINAPDTSVVEAIVRGFQQLKLHDIPIRVMLGQRKAGPGLYWNNDDFPLETPFKGWLLYPVNINYKDLNYGGPMNTKSTVSIAELVDELVIHYPDWTGSDPSPSSNHILTADEQAILNKQFEHEARGWQRWWHYHALKLTALRTLEIRMPQAFDCFHSKRLALVLLGGDGGRDDGTGRGEWFLRHNVMEQGRNTRFVVRRWERHGGDRFMRWDKKKTEQTDEVFEGMVPEDELWARLETTTGLDMEKILEKVEIPKLKSRAEESVESRSTSWQPPAVVQSIEEVPPAESTSISQVPAEAETESIDLEMEDTGHDAEELTITDDAMRHRAISPFDSSLSQASSDFSATPYDEEVHGRLATQPFQSLDPADAAGTASTGKPKPRARSKVRGREKRKADEMSGSRESSRERRSKRQASQEPDAPPPMPTQRRRSKMERELDWSLRK
ncbi:hypothetical protein IWZ00DRAFT_275542 [Phyllosticta capitalensis]